MTHRLSFWIVVSAVLSLAAGALAFGPTPAALIALVQTPMLLAVVLLARAVVLRLRGGDPALQVGARTVLRGAASFVVPALFLVAWIGLREAGIVQGQLCMKRRSHQIATTTQPWTDGAQANVIPGEGLTVTAPKGAFGEAFARELRHKWSTSDGELHGDVKLTGAPPSAWWPLYKATDVKFRVDVALQLHRQDGAVRASSIGIDFTAECEVIGIASNRDFQRWLGGELGEEVREAIGDAVKKATRKS